MKQKVNWWVDLVLFVGFIITFFLDLTGLELHQWLGVFCGVLIVYHTLVHWNWITAVTKRFFFNTSGKARLNYVIDAGLMIGFLLILITGLVISSWANLYLSNYFVWLNLHIVVSMATLALTAVKLAVHWQWISLWARKSIPRVNWIEKVALVPAEQPIKMRSTGMGRREFLQVFSAVGAASVLAMLSGTEGLADIASVTSDAEVETDETQTTAEAVQVFEQENVVQPTATSEVPAVVEPTAPATATPTQPVVVVQNVPASSSSSSSSCTVQCNRGCSYPGHCGKYRDTNGNSKCDLGECI